MRFLHCADIHLDSPLRGLERYEGAPVEEVRAAPRRAFESLVDTAIRERVDFVVIAGDLYDGDWPDFNTGLYFARQMARLGESGIPVFVLRGNHDAVSRISRSLRLPGNVHLFDAVQPHTLCDEQLGIAVHGQSFATAGVTEDLAARYPTAIPGLFNIGVLHTALTGRAGHEPYAPTSLDVLRSKGYHYWALGHVHAREIVATEPWVVFPGNLQGRHIREQGGKGAEMVTVEDGLVSTQPMAFDVLRWTSLDLDIANVPDQDALLDLATARLRLALQDADGRALAARVRIGGCGALHKILATRLEDVQAELRRCALELSGGRIWLEKILVDARPPIDLERLSRGDDPIAYLLQDFARLRADPAALATLGQEVLGELTAKLPSELVGGPDGLNWDAVEALRELITEAEGELLARLVQGNST